MFRKLNYWYKRFTGIKVYTENELLSAIEQVRGTKRAIVVLGDITITQPLMLPHNIIFLFRPLQIL